MARKKVADTPESKKKKGVRNYIISISVVLILTILSLLYSLWGAGEGDLIKGGAVIWDALVNCNPWWLVCIVGLVALSYFIDGLVIYVFCRLYTRDYHYHQGVVNSFIGAYYNNVTPGASGGQVVQVYTLKTQGIEVSNGASIMVMWFILYQVALILLDVFAIGFQWNNIMAIGSFDTGIELWGWNGEIQMLPLMIIGFVLNVSVIILLFLMSLSHRFHNFILHYVIGALGKIRLLKNPNKTRESLRVQVENFRMELKRLQSNIRVTILIVVLLASMLIIRFSIPYFAGLALGAYPDKPGFDIGMMFDACFRSAFHQMVTGLIPIPGSSGVSEVFFVSMFQNFFDTKANVMAAQIIWRTATFHLLLIVGGLIAAFYRSRPKETFVYANRQTFVDLQLSTYAERKRSIDTLYETRQLSRQAIEMTMARPLDKGLETGDASNIRPLPSIDKKEGRVKR